jgi:hypothetical protein
MGSCWIGGIRAVLMMRRNLYAAIPVCATISAPSYKADVGQLARSATAVTAGLVSSVFDDFSQTDRRAPDPAIRDSTTRQIGRIVQPAEKSAGPATGRN